MNSRTNVNVSIDMDFVFGASESKYDLVYNPDDYSTNGLYIILNLEENDICISQLAPTDRIREISVEELNSLRDSINCLREMEGEPMLTEDEWPSAVEPEVYALYGSHAMKRIKNTFKKGELLEQGIVAWY